MKAYRFVNLNVHSHYSIMDGCANIWELVDAAIKDKMPFFRFFKMGTSIYLSCFTNFAVKIREDASARQMQTSLTSFSSSLQGIVQASLALLLLRASVVSALA